MSVKPVALVVGAGPGSGGAICRRFAREGQAACGLGRGDELEAWVEPR